MTLLALHQRRYYAWLLTRRAAGDTVGSLASTLVDAQVDLNPHQVEAALFACRNPLSRGVIDREIKEVRRTAATSPTLEDKLSWQKQQRELEGKRSKLRRELFARQDEVEAQRDDLISQLEVQLQQRVEERTLFTVEWELV